MNDLLKVLSLIPYLGAGISVIHSDLSLASKQTAAADAVQIMMLGASSLMPGEATLIDELGTVGLNAMSGIIKALHPSTTTATAGASAAPAATLLEASQAATE
jgi:hypothetical protein